MTVVTAMRTLVVDDEPVARQLVSAIAQRHPNVELVGECVDGGEAIECIRSEHPDLVLLDIQMPDTNGFEVLAAIDASIRPAVIFLTAHDRYAVDAFRCHAVHYLLKPVDDDDLLAAIDRADSLRNQPTNLAPTRFERIMGECAGQESRRRWFLARSGEHRVPLQWQDVEMFEAARNYIRAYVAGKLYLIRSTLQNLEEEVRESEFVRVHRSVIVNVSKIKRLHATGRGDFEIELIGGNRVTLSRRYRRRLEAILGSLS